jgi:glycogen operon protein
MLLMGDEVRRSQHGNNNAYVQDNETSWFDWTLVERHRDLRRFVKTLIRHRKLFGAESGIEGRSLSEVLRDAEIRPHGIRLNRPDLSPHSHSIAVTVRANGRAAMIHAMFNAYWEALKFELPDAGSEAEATWRLWVDTYRATPHDIHELPGPVVIGETYTVEPRSLVILLALRAKTHAIERLDKNEGRE